MSYRDFLLPGDELDGPFVFPSGPVLGKEARPVLRVHRNLAVVGPADQHVRLLSGQKELDRSPGLLDDCRVSPVMEIRNRNTARGWLAIYPSPRYMPSK